MTTDQLLISGILIGLLVLFIWGRVRYDVVAVGGLVLATAIGLVPAGQAFSGFSHPAVITVAAVLVLSRALSYSGALDRLVDGLRRYSDSAGQQIGALSCVAAGLSGFMNNVGALALLMPVSIESSRTAGRSPRLVLMPVAFASLLGGMVTLIGTPPNILIATFRAERTGERFAMFDFALVGGPVALAGIAFIVLFGWRLMRSNGKDASAQLDAFEIEAYLSELSVPKASVACGMTLSEIEAMTEDIDVAIVGLVRRKHHYPRPPQHEPLQSVDRLLVEGAPEDLDEFVKKLGLRVAGRRPDKSLLVRAKQAVFAEAVVTPGSRMIGRTIGSMRLKGRYNVTLLGVSRQGRPYRGRLNDFRIRAGDVLLVEGLEEDVPEALSVLGCLPLAQRSLSLGNPSRGWMAIALFASAIAVAMVGLLPIEVAFAGACVGTILFGILPTREIYSSIDWPVIVLLGALLPVGAAMETTGMTREIAGAISHLAGAAGPAVTIALLICVTIALTSVLNNAATAVVLAPAAMGIADALGASPDPFLMAVAVGASASFLTPIAHQNNALIMGPGGYKFSDYWKLGLPLEIVVVVVAVPTILIAWPI